MKFHPDLIKIIDVQDDKIQCPFCLKLTTFIESDYIIKCKYKCGFFCTALTINNQLFDGLHFELEINNEHYVFSQLYSAKVFHIEKILKNIGPPTLMSQYSTTILRIDNVILDLNFKSISSLKEQLSAYIMLS